MGMTWRAAMVSLLLFGLFVGVWHLATMGSGPAVPMDPEYAKLVGATASQGKSAMPGPAEVGPFRRAFTIILPAAAPTILTGMRISIGIAWLVIVAAEMLVGGTGIGYFVWNEWNNLSITNVITAILVIGVVGMVLDQVLARATRLVTFPE